MSTFVDTSALLAVLDADATEHVRADRTWSTLLGQDRPLHTTNYVLVETFALVQARLGLQATAALDASIVPVLRVLWVDEALHRAGVAALLAAHRRGVSLVDCVSFESMRRLGIADVFAFDRHFRQFGFTLVP